MTLNQQNNFYKIIILLKVKYFKLFGKLNFYINVYSFCMIKGRFR